MKRYSIMPPGLADSLTYHGIMAPREPDDTLLAFAIMPPVGDDYEGDPGVRDPRAPCEYFTPGEPRGAMDCAGDGHYLCKECVNFDASTEAEP